MSDINRIGPSVLLNRFVNKTNTQYLAKSGRSEGDVVTISDEGKKKHILGQVMASISEGPKAKGE